MRLCEHPWLYFVVSQVAQRHFPKAELSISWKPAFQVFSDPSVLFLTIACKSIEILKWKALKNERKQNQPFLLWSWLLEPRQASWSQPGLCISRTACPLPPIPKLAPNYVCTWFWVIQTPLLALTDGLLLNPEAPSTASCTWAPWELSSNVPMHHLYLMN